MSTLSIVCPVHGVRGALAPYVRIASRAAADGTVQHTLTAPCPEAGCPIAVLVPPRGCSEALVERLFAHGAQVVAVSRDTPASALVEFPLPRAGRPTSSVPTPGGVA